MARDSILTLAVLVCSPAILAGAGSASECVSTPSTSTGRSSGSATRPTRTRTKVPLFFQRLREMGVNAGMVYDGGDPALLVENKFPTTSRTSSTAACA